MGERLMNSRKKKKLIVVVYILAIVGGYTVCANVYYAGASAVKHAQSWVSSLEFKAPVFVSNN
jgi:hypothetical protein